MPRRIFRVSLVVMLLLTVASAQQKSPNVGRWEGSITLPVGSLQIVLTETGSDSGIKATIDIPEQGTLNLPITNFRFEAPKLHFGIKAGPRLAIFDGEVTGEKITGTFQQATVMGTFEPAHPALQASSLYKEEEVKIQIGAITLAGTLTLPPSGGPFPAVVMIAGSDTQNRDEELLEFKPFRLIADHLTRNGIAVLRCDDPGVGYSKGSIPQSTSSDFAADVLQEVAFLKARPEIAKTRIGVLGYSVGGLLGPLAASRSTDIAFVIMMSGPALTGEKIILAQSALNGKATGESEAVTERNAARQQQIFDAVRSGSGWDAVEAEMRATYKEKIKGMPEQQRDTIVEDLVKQSLALMKTPWFKFFLDYDPAPALEKVTCPLLATFGELDLQVPADINRIALEQAVKRGGNKNVTIKAFPKANDRYQEATTGNLDEYDKLKKEFVPGLLDLFSGWILQNIK